MKTISTIIYISSVLLLFTSCKDDFLDRAPSVNLPEEEVFSNPVLASQFANNAYNFLVDDYARLNTHRGMTGQAADEAVSSNNDVSIRTLALGTYHDHYERGGATNDITNVYSSSYSGIRITNVMLAGMDRVKWTGAQSADRIKGEMHFLRAFFYFELIKRFGGVPLTDQPFEANDDIDLPRNTYEECVDFIIRDLDQAEKLLPASYEVSDYGRATSGAAMALRSRVLLFAASKLNNESNDLNKWKKAADAAGALIKEKRYSLHPNYSELLNVAESPEYIMIKIRGPRSTSAGILLDFAMSPGSGGAQGTLNPTQNHVDLYEMKNSGRPISDPLSGYDSQKPYTGRDPRFQANILYNGAAWQGRTGGIGTWSQTAANGNKTFGDDYREANPNYTVTRYYSRKMWPEVYRRGSSTTALLNFVFFRYAEVLLNYAEAKNEAEGTPHDSVYLALNEIRARVGMPALQSTDPRGPGYVPASREAMRARIRNERAVELAFEEFRWYDVMRWKAGKEIVTQPMYGMDVVKNTNGTFTYTRLLLPPNYQKIHEDYMHRYPIPRVEIYKSKGKLIQNPGWE